MGVVVVLEFQKPRIDSNIDEFVPHNIDVLVEVLLVDGLRLGVSRGRRWTSENRTCCSAA